MAFQLESIYLNVHIGGQVGDVCLADVNIIADVALMIINNI